MQEQSIQSAGYVDQAAFDAARHACREFASANANLEKEDLLLALIELSIEEGANTDQAIIAAIDTLGKYTTKHIAFLLKAGAGSDPSRYRWRKIALKTYALH